MNQNGDEKELLHRIAQSDQAAFTLMMDQYTPVIYPYLLYWIKDVHVVQEVTQDVFIRIWNNREKLPGLANFSGYLYVIARNRAHSALNDELLRSKNEIRDGSEEYLVQPSSDFEVKELQALLDAAVETLPPKRREIFKLSRREELTYEEIAQQQRISKNTVKGHIVAALVYLRDYLKEHSDVILLCFFSSPLFGSYYFF